MSSFLSTSPLRVSEANRLIRQTLEGILPMLQVQGEISGLSRASSGHFYFNLCDEEAEIRCVFWRTQAQKLNFVLKEGQQVTLFARTTFYEARGTLQLSVETIALSGQGNLYEAFLQRKAKLAADGLFDLSRKKKLPAFPRHIAIVTSRQAAALKDVLVTLNRRAPHIRLSLYPTLVQGDTAPAAIISAIKAADQSDADAILLCRGGGSLEDLQAFNDELLARTIALCRLPVVCGVGHESDISIADLVADVRAATPTAAAEILSTESLQIRGHIAQMAARLQSEALRQIHQKNQHLDLFVAKLIHPAEKIKRQRAQLTQLRDRLVFQSARLCEQRRMKLKAAISLLSTLDPAAVLQRGYSLTTDANGHVITSSTQVTVGDTLHVQLAAGEIETRVKTATLI